MDVTYLTISHLPAKELARIFSKIRISETASYQNVLCWEWTSTLNKGYGYISWSRRPTPAYRLLYAWLVEPLPDKTSKKELDHLCKNKRCVNPIHLELVTGAINNLRSDGPCARNARKTHCKQGHPLSGDNLHHRSTANKRFCVACMQQWGVERRAKHGRTIYMDKYNAKYRIDNKERLREYSKQRRQSPEWQAYMREYLKEYRRTYKPKPLTPEQKARKNKLERERRRKYGRSDRPKKPLP